ncbi:MAG TPA: (d)CMP kinase [Ancylobacter sp.]
MIIAIDGPAASGKGTLAKRLAEHYHLPHLDTGLLYRAVGLKVLDRGVRFDDVPTLIALAYELDMATLDPEALKSGPVGEAASRVAACTAVREVLLRAQTEFAHQPGGAVLDGRDIGTVIAPDAEVKIFVTATPEARAQRRFKEFSERGDTVTLEDVLTDVRRRDARDSGRATAPLVVADDAVVLDNTHLDKEQSWQRALDIVESRLRSLSDDR